MKHLKQIQAARQRINADVGTHDVDKLDFDGLLEESAASAVRVALKANRKFLDEHALSIEVQDDGSGDDSADLLILLKSDNHEGFSLSEGRIDGPAYSAEQLTGLANLLKSLDSLKQSPHLKGGRVEAAYFCERNAVVLSITINGF